MFATDVSVGFIDSQTLHLRFALGRIIEAHQRADIPSGAGTPDGGGWVRDANGTLLGQVQQDGSHFMPVDQFRNSVIADLFQRTGDPAPVDDAGDWTVRVNGRPVAVDMVTRKSQIADGGVTQDWDRFETIQDVLLHLSAPLASGDRVSLAFEDPDFQRIAGTYGPAAVSEADPVNLTGYDPNDPR